MTLPQGYSTAKVEALFQKQAKPLQQKYDAYGKAAGGTGRGLALSGLMEFAKVGTPAFGGARVRAGGGGWGGGGSSGESGPEGDAAPSQGGPWCQQQYPGC